MKKIIAMLLLAALLSLFGCATGKPGDQTPSDDGSTPPAGPSIGAAYEVISDTMVRHSCKDGEKYDKRLTETNEAAALRHNGIELGTLDLYGCDRTANGYRIVNQGDLRIKYKVTQNLGALVGKDGTQNGAESFWLNNDTNSGAKDTDIEGAIGIGAYYVVIKYTDGEQTAFSKTNFLANAQKGDSLDLVTAADFRSGKTVESINITVLYELHAEGPGLLGIKWHEYTNWRCEYTYKF